jgi:GntP family gluconate:H+ symporter
MTAIGALFGLLISVFLIIKKISPTYSLIAGAIVGGLLGGLSLADTVSVMTDGVKDVTPAIIRILTAGAIGHTNQNRSSNYYFQCHHQHTR